MASYTPNLNLLMKDPVADGADTFNIQTMLNENWKKIDAAVLRAIAAAAAYDAGKTYQQGDFCTQGGLLYRANQAIAQPESWTAGHWTAISITDVIRGLTAADVGAAPEGYGLGGAAKRLTSEDDLNNIWENGWYFWGSDKPANAPKMNPGGAADSYIFMRVTNYDFQNVLQEYWSLNQNSQNQARRINRNGTWGLLEWYNPPMQIGVEYRTTERFNAKPVYAQIVNCGALEARTMKTVMLKIPVDWVVSCTGMQGPNTNRHRQASPFYYNNGSAELVFYCSAEAYHYETEDNLYVYLYATQATTASYALVKYTKESD